MERFAEGPIAMTWEPELRSMSHETEPAACAWLKAKGLHG
jgi:hypothetical protein